MIFWLSGCVVVYVPFVMWYLGCAPGSKSQSARQCTECCLCLGAGTLLSQPHWKAGTLLQAKLADEQPNTHSACRPTSHQGSIHLKVGIHSNWPKGNHSNAAAVT